MNEYEIKESKEKFLNLKKIEEIAKINDSREARKILRKYSFRI